MVIYGCGVITGSLLLKMEMPAPATTSGVSVVPVSVTNQPPPWAAQIQRLEFLRRIQKQLNLTPSQREEIARIMKESQERSRPLWDKIAPQMRDEVRRVHQEIRQVLTHDQQVKFEELLKSHPRKSESSGKQRLNSDQPQQTNSL
jgi:Spy/CpxP family protein refolding chaperone